MDSSTKDSIRLLFRFIPDELYIKMYYFAKYKRLPNLKDPKTLVEKLQWLKLNYRKPEQTLMVDKYRVKQFVAETVGEQYVVPLLGVWDDPADIDFDSLPDQFVMKCNHNSRVGNCVCANKADLDVEAVRSELKKGLQQDYYLIGREWPYKNVDRKIICEQFLKNADGSPLVDYKFYCFGGEPKYFMVSVGEAEHNAKNHKFDMNLQSVDHFFKKLPTLRADEVVLPENIDEMIRIVRALCKGMPHVRIDLYNIDGRIYFGEITFYSNAGFLSIDSKEYAQQLADSFELPV